MRDCIEYAGDGALNKLNGPMISLVRGLPILALLAVPLPAEALTINAAFDSSITGNADASAVEGAINSAIGQIDSLYSNPGTVAIVFTQQSNASFLGQSTTTDVVQSYSQYTGALATVASREPANAVLSTAVANLSHGNGNASDAILVTSAAANIVFGSAAPNCFGAGGTFVSNCSARNQGAYAGVVTLGLNSNRALNFGTTAVANQYSAVNTFEHEINEILGGGGQGSMLNPVASCNANPTAQGCGSNNNFASDLGVLDLYRYAAAGTASFTTSGGASSYFSVDGGVTKIVGFNQSSTSDYGDFGSCNNVQSASSCIGNFVPYTTTSPEYAMMEAIGYNGVPEPGSIALFASGLAGLRTLRQRRGGSGGSSNSQGSASPKPRTLMPFGSTAS